MAVNYQIVPPHPIEDPVEITSDGSDDTETSSFEMFGRFLGVVFFIIVVFLLWRYPTSSSSSGGSRLAAFPFKKLKNKFG